MEMEVERKETKPKSSLISSLFVNKQKKTRDLTESASEEKKGKLKGDKQKGRSSAGYKGTYKAKEGKFRSKESTSSNKRKKEKHEKEGRKNRKDMKQKKKKREKEERKNRKNKKKKKKG